MRYCHRCLYPENHPLGLTFDLDGVCSGCRIHEEKDQIDWDERFEKLKILTTQYKNKNRSVHDCVVPVSGARDSYFVVHFVKKILGMTPLLVNYNCLYNTRMGIRNLSYLKTLLGCDFMQCTVDPNKVIKITRETLKLLGSMYWHCISGQTVFPVRVAVQYKIPLIIWGAHQGVDQVGMYSHLDEVEMTRKYRKDHDLLGVEAEDLLDNTHLTVSDLEQYFYPNGRELESVGVRGIYLNNFVRWDSKKQHELMIRNYGYETMQQQRSFDTYNDVDSFHYTGLHDYIKFVKFGYGKVSDHATREIRLKRMTRKTGIELVRKYQFVKPRDTKLFLDWIGLKEVEFWEIINLFRSNIVWKKLSNGDYELVDSVSYTSKEIHNDVSIPTQDNCVFQLNRTRDPNPFEDKYVIIGRGWVDNDSELNH